MEKKLISGDEDVRPEEKTIGVVSRGRSLRHKEKKLYTDEGIDDDEIEGRRTFNLDEKIRKALGPGQTFYVEMKGADVNLKYFQQNGFVSPILVRDKTGLGLRMPSENFTVDDVKRCVGSYRMLDVVDVTTQKDLTMSVKEWVRYYTSPSRERLLNVISLEFSHTKLENYVDQPEVIHQMDWVDLAWPWYLKEYQTEATNVLDRMMYPKVQKYCLMSVKGCYTDFHIDMGGTSVWYHILKGKKVFWLIPPTEENLQAYENWTLSAKQGDIFFGDMVSICYHITLEAGWTFFIPTGWIHAVYTPEDSLVFGGNFLHSFGIQMQLRIWEIETRTHVPTKFRYPLFCELHWYVLERYVSCLMCKDHRTKSAEEICLGDGKTYEQTGEGKFGRETTEQNNCKKESESSEKPFATSGPVENIGLSMVCDGEAVQIESGTENKTADETQYLASRVSSSRNIFEAVFNIIADDKVCEMEQNCPSRRLPRYSGSNCGISRKSFAWIDLTKHEREGLNAIVLWLEKLPQTKKFIPKDIPDPLGLLTDVKSLLKSHSTDSHEKAVTGRVILTWPVRKKRRQKKMVKAFSTGNTGGPSQNGTGMWHYRRVRCRECEPCTRADCGDCYFCRDMKKFGGPGRKKQTCVSRQCLAPMLPSNAICQICNQGDGVTAAEGVSESFVSEEQLTRIEIMECRICFDIVHPFCLKKSHPEISHPGVIDEDLPNSWECARCCEAGKEGQGKQRHKFFTVPPESSSARRRHRRRESSSSSSSSGSCTSSDSVISKRNNQICSESDLHSGSEFVQSPQRKRQGVSLLELPSQLRHTQSTAVDQQSSSSVLCGSSSAVRTKDLDESSSIQKRTDILKISLSPDKSKSAAGVKSWKIARVEMGSKKKNYQIKDLKPTLTQNAINTDDCGKRKKKIRPGNSGSEFDSMPEANAVRFTSPLRINSHGREIMTPRRYLI